MSAPCDRFCDQSACGCEIDYCVCCGNETEGADPYWCMRCTAHVGRFTAPPYDRTYFAINGVDCPFQVGREFPS